MNYSTIKMVAKRPSSETIYPPKKRALYEHKLLHGIDSYVTNTSNICVTKDNGLHDNVKEKCVSLGTSHLNLFPRPRSDSLHSLPSVTSEHSESGVSKSRESSPIENRDVFDHQTPERNPLKGYAYLKRDISKPLFPSSDSENSIHEEQNSPVMNTKNERDCTPFKFGNETNFNEKFESKNLKLNAGFVNSVNSKESEGHAANSAHWFNLNQELENSRRSVNENNRSYGTQMRENPAPKSSDDCVIGPQMSHDLLDRNEEIRLTETAFGARVLKPLDSGGVNFANGQIMEIKPVDLNRTHDVRNNMIIENGVPKLVDSNVYIVENGLSLFDCKNCEQRFSDEASLRQHDCKSREKVCWVCHMGFSATEKLLHHMKACHNGLKPYKCQHCDREFGQYNNLRRHLRVHREKQFKCSLCDREFNEEFYLKMHMSTHTGRRIYSCGVCNAGFPSSQELKLHVKTHSPSQLHTCDVCAKSFSKACVLRQHKKGHSGERPHKCELCLKTFIHRHHLTMHLRSHTEQKLFICDICKKEFTQSSHLYKHIRSHEESGEGSVKDISSNVITKKTVVTHQTDKPEKRKPKSKMSKVVPNVTQQDAQTFSETMATDLHAAWSVSKHQGNISTSSEYVNKLHLSGMALHQYKPVQDQSQMHDPMKTQDVKTVPKKVDLTSNPLPSVQQSFGLPPLAPKSFQPHQSSLPYPVSHQSVPQFSYPGHYAPMMHPSLGNRVVNSGYDSIYRTYSHQMHNYYNQLYMMNYMSQNALLHQYHSHGHIEDKGHGHMHNTGQGHMPDQGHDERRRSKNTKLDEQQLEPGQINNKTFETKKEETIETQPEIHSQNISHDMVNSTLVPNLLNSSDHLLNRCLKLETGVSKDQNAAARLNQDSARSTRNTVEPLTNEQNGFHKLDLEVDRTIENKVTSENGRMDDGAEQTNGSLELTEDQKAKADELEIGKKSEDHSTRADVAQQLIRMSSGLDEQHPVTMTTEEPYGSVARTSVVESGLSLMIRNHSSNYSNYSSDLADNSCKRVDVINRNDVNIMDNDTKYRSHVTKHGSKYRHGAIDSVTTFRNDEMSHDAKHRNDAISHDAKYRNDAMSHDAKYRNDAMSHDAKYRNDAMSHDAKYRNDAMSHNAKYRNDAMSHDAKYRNDAMSKDAKYRNDATENSSQNRHDKTFEYRTSEHLMNMYKALPNPGEGFIKLQEMVEREKELMTMDNHAINKTGEFDEVKDTGNSVGGEIVENVKSNVSALGRETRGVEGLTGRDIQGKVVDIEPSPVTRRQHECGRSQDFDKHTKGCDEETEELEAVNEREASETIVGEIDEYRDGNVVDAMKMDAESDKNEMVEGEVEDNRRRLASAELKISEEEDAENVTQDEVVSTEHGLQDSFEERKLEIDLGEADDNTGEAEDEFGEAKNADENNRIEHDSINVEQGDRNENRIENEYSVGNEQTHVEEINVDSKEAEENHAHSGNEDFNVEIEDTGALDLSCHSRKDDEETVTTETRECQTSGSMIDRDLYTEHGRFWLFL